MFIEALLALRKILLYIFGEMQSLESGDLMRDIYDGKMWQDLQTIAEHPIQNNLCLIRLFQSLQRDTVFCRFYTVHAKKCQQFRVVLG